jgi:hypothetical protein
MTTVWELDFYSRPVLDENQKKLWEVLICETPIDIQRQPDSLFRYAEFCPNSQVNSVWLREAIERAIEKATQPPDKIRFFRRQMSNMITKACEEAGIPAYSSRRTLVLPQWIQARMQDYYPTLPNYQASNNPSVAMPAAQPQPLPDALVGDRWASVTLEAAAFLEMPEWEIGFSESFPLSLFGVAPDQPIPGLIIYSSRALPLAAWMSGLELAFVRYQNEPPAQFLLETGGVDSWILAALPKPALQAEAKDFEAAKRDANGVHFIAVQSPTQTDAFAGFWLLQEVQLA